MKIRPILAVMIIFLLAACTPAAAAQTTTTPQPSIASTAAASITTGTTVLTGYNSTDSCTRCGAINHRTKISHQFAQRFWPFGVYAAA